MREGRGFCMMKKRKRSTRSFASVGSPMKLMSIAMKPLCEPPFPIERIEEMTALMGGDGTLHATCR